MMIMMMNTVKNFRHGVSLPQKNAKSPVQLPVSASRISWWQVYFRRGQEPNPRTVIRTSVLSVFLSFQYYACERKEKFEVMQFFPKKLIEQTIASDHWPNMPESPMAIVQMSRHHHPDFWTDLLLRRIEPASAPN